MRESDIMHENGAFWVCRDRDAYTVLRVECTHSIPDSSYAADPDGMSLAIARCDYLARRHAAPSVNLLDAMRARNAA